MRTFFKTQYLFDHWVFSTLRQGTHGMSRQVASEGASALHGWGCTPTGDPPADVIASPSQEDSKPSCFPAALHRGWRRTMLYGILVLLMLLIFLNIALTLWIVSVLKLSISGIGPIKIVRGGINLAGQAWVLDRLVASSLASQPAQPITLRAHRNFTVLVEEPDSKDHARLLIKRDRMECRGQTFQVTDQRGNGVFKASRDEVRVFANALAADGPGGFTVKTAVQTSAVKAPPGSDLQIESTTRRLDLRAPQSIYLESRAGSIDITSHSNIKLDSIVGAIKIEAQNIIIGNLKEVNVTSRPLKNAKNIKNVKVYQLCACATGKLFLAAPNAPCEALEEDKDLCR